MMNPGHGRGPGLGCGSSSVWKPGDVVSDQFPAGLRVLVVDDDPTCLMILEKMLRTCLYEVTKCNRAEIALSLLRKNKNGFDVVISDVHMPDMDGFKLLEHVGLEMDLPVIMMSADDSKHVVMKGVTHGACDYLIKPVRIEALKNIWQHVVRKRRSEWSILEQSGSFEEGGQQKPIEEADNNSSSVNEGNSNWRNTKRRKEEDGDEQEDKEESSTLKKPRVVWSVELHQQFVAAVNQLGVDKAVPKKILELMNVQGLTRENVASHLQKYRIYLRRLGGVSQHPGNLNNSIMNPQEANFGPLSSFNGYDLQALAVTGQLPAQSLAQLQAASLGQQAAPRPGITIPPLVDQRNILGFENPKVRLGDGQPQDMNGNKQMNLLHGIPTGMEPKHLAGLQTIAGSGMNMQIVGPCRVPNGQSSSMLMPGVQQMQPRGPVLPPSLGQPIIPNNVSGSNSMPEGVPGNNGLPNYVSRRNVISDNVSGRNGMPDSVSGSNGLPNNVSRRNGIPDNVLVRNGVNDQGIQAYNMVSRRPAPMLSNFPLNQTAEVTVNSFPLTSASGISIQASKVVAYQDEVNSSDVKGSSFAPSYDIFNDLQQHNKPQDWDLHDVGFRFDDAPHSQGNLDATSAFSVSEGYSSSSAQRNGHGPNANISQHMASVHVGNSVRVKSERASEAGCHLALYQDQYNQEDLMSALLKPQEGIAPAENEFDFDGYSLDNIPV